MGARRDRMTEEREADPASAFAAARGVVSTVINDPTQSQMGLISIAILAAGIMVANAVHELDATMRRIDQNRDE